jgi:uncharacterized phage-associated protein
MTTASNIGKYILLHFHEKGVPVNNLKLQKLVYYTQAWHLALYDKPIFMDPIEAWVHGPVAYPVFQEYRAFRWNPISGMPMETCADKALASHLGEVLNVYGSMDAIALERMTHAEPPWKIARAGLPPDVPCRNVISNESMKRYYRSLSDGA